MLCSQAAGKRQGQGSEGTCPWTCAVLRQEASAAWPLIPKIYNPGSPGPLSGADGLLPHTFLGLFISRQGRKGSSRAITQLSILGSGPAKSNLENVEVPGDKEEPGADRVLQIMKSRLVLSHY